MKKFLKRMLVYGTFLLLFFPVTVIVYGVFGSASDFDKLEVDDVVTKLHYLKKYRDEYNTVFVGSSMVYRHFNTEVFDSLCRTNSFNLGSGGFRPVRSFDMLEVLYKEDLGLDYILFELNRFETLKQNFNSGASIRSLSWKYYKIMTGSVMQSDYSPLRKTQYILMYTYTLAYKYFGTGVLGQITKQKKEIDLSPENPILRNDGFYAIDDDVRENHGADDIKRNKFLSEHQSLLTRLSDMNTFSKPSGYHPPVIPYTDYMKDLQKRFREKGTQLIFIINPRNFDKNDVKLLNQVAYHLPDSSVIDLYDSRLYPEFYDYNYSFDMAHLTKAGADMYTQHLAGKFNRVRSVVRETAVN